MISFPALPTSEGERAAAGEALLAIKRELGHGHFKRAFADAKLPYAYTSAARWMREAKRTAAGAELRSELEGFAKITPTRTASEGISADDAARLVEHVIDVAVPAADEMVPLWRMLGLCITGAKAMPALRVGELRSAAIEANRRLIAAIQAADTLVSLLEVLPEDGVVATMPMVEGALADAGEIEDASEIADDGEGDASEVQPAACEPFTGTTLVLTSEQVAKIREVLPDADDELLECAFQKADRVARVKSMTIREPAVWAAEFVEQELKRVREIQAAANRRPTWKGLPTY